MLNAANEHAVALADPLSHAVAVDVMQRDLEAWHQERVDHVHEVANRHAEFDGKTSEHDDRSTRLLLLNGAASVERAVEAQVPNRDVVRDGSQGDAVNRDTALCDIGSEDREAISSSTHELALECVETKQVEAHEVFDPIILHAEIIERLRRHSSIVRVPE